MTRLPPGQQLAAEGKWPIVGERACIPLADGEEWTIEVAGSVREPRTWTVAELRQLPQFESVVDIHCVTRWSKLGMRFSGVRLEDLLSASEPKPRARYVRYVARSDRGHDTSLPLADALSLGTMVVLDHAGEPLTSEHGGPVRIVTPGRYFYKSLKWLARIELTVEETLGYWEREAGYHQHADPCLEERYIIRDIPRNKLQRMLASREFMGRDLLGIEAAGRDLAGLAAEDALLRNADFRNASLVQARFDRANLSNARFQGADLQLASFRDADLEGADFSRADLRGADFTNASLLGATFIEPDDVATGARIDGDTRFDLASLEQLAPQQADYLRSQWSA